MEEQKSEKPTSPEPTPSEDGEPEPKAERKPEGDLDS